MGLLDNMGAVKDAVKRAGTKSEMAYMEHAHFKLKDGTEVNMVDPAVIRIVVGGTESFIVTARERK